MMVIVYINWNGTIKALQEWEKEQKARWEKIKGVKLLGMYTPTIAWNRAWVFETDSVDTLLKNQGQRTDDIRNTDMVVLL
jgi:hypothetical protein